MRRGVLAFVWVFVIQLLASATAGQVHAADTIKWELVNPFRLFVDPKDTDIHRVAYAALDEASKAAPVASVERRLGAQAPRGWAEPMLERICWNGSKSQYGCESIADYINPSSHRIQVQAPAAPQSATCSWQVEAAAQRGSRRGATSAASRASAPCGETVVLEVPYPGGGDVVLSVDDQRIATERVVVQDLFIVGVGDSFGSGDGNPDQPVRFSAKRSGDYDPNKKENRFAGYPVRDGAWNSMADVGFWQAAAQWTSRSCRRSLYSHQLRAALQLAIENPKRSVTYVGLACSGAQITDGLFLRYKGTEWVPNPPRLSQISAVAEAQCGRNAASIQEYASAFTMSEQLLELQNVALNRCPREVARKIDLLFVSIGGNDIGFSRLVANAILNDEGALRKLGGWLGQVQNVEQTRARLEILDLRYKALRRAIHNVLHVPWEEPERVVLTGYPYLARLADGKNPCPDKSGGMSVIPGFEIDGERTAEAEGLADQLAARMRRYADVNGFTFVDAHRSVFAGRGLCAGVESGPPGSPDDLRMPLKQGEDWVPFNPADHRPYQPRNRWVLTPTDAFLAVNFHAQAPGPARSRQKFDPLQLLLAGTYSGAFHPSAEGQAVIADAVVAKARSVLRKHSR